MTQGTITQFWKRALGPVVGDIARAGAALMLLLACALSPALAQTVTYFHNDVSGTPVLATDASGNVVWKENYQPYGSRLNNPAAEANNRLGFAGKPYDAETGLSYIGARYYDPLLGRFMGVDLAPVRVGDIHSINRYAYANNNPYKYIDPDGKSPALAIEVGVPLLIGGAIYYATQTPEKQQAMRASLGRFLDNLARSESSSQQGQKQEAATGASNDEGCIYCVSGDKTSSGKDYVGSTDNMDQRKRDKSDSRDRDGAEVVDTYPKSDRETRRTKEQQAINDRGGVDKLDNKRNEVAPKNWGSRGITPPPAN